MHVPQFGKAMKKLENGGITGNGDVELLYSASVSAGGALELVQAHRAKLDAPALHRKRWEAVRDRSTKTHPGRVDRITVEAVTLNEAISRMKLIAVQYFLTESRQPWRVNGAVVDL